MTAADGHDVRQAERAERQEKRERSLGAVGGGRERVQSEHRDARERTDFCSLLLLGCEAATEHDVRERPLGLRLRGCAVADHRDDMRVSAPRLRCTLAHPDPLSSGRQNTTGITVMPRNTLKARVDGKKPTSPPRSKTSHGRADNASISAHTAVARRDGGRVREVVPLDGETERRGQRRRKRQRREELRRQGRVEPPEEGAGVPVRVDEADVPAREGRREGIVVPLVTLGLERGDAELRRHGQRWQDGALIVQVELRAEEHIVEVGDLRDRV